MVAADGGSNATRICLERFDFADSGCVGYILASVLQHVVVVNNVEGVGPIDSFALTLRTYTDTLPQMAHFVGV